MKTLLFAALIAVTAGTAFAGEGNAPVTKQSKELEKLKTLEGKWEGKMIEGDKPIDLTVTYHVTSGGSAVVETISPGTPHEMVSVYHDENGKLTMTHYCMLGNQPKLVITESKPNQFDLGFAKNNVINQKAEDHMHSLQMVFIDDNTMVEKWGSMHDGKERDAKTVFKISRVQ